MKPTKEKPHLKELFVTAGKLYVAAGKLSYANCNDLPKITGKIIARGELALQILEEQDAEMDLIRDLKLNLKDLKDEHGDMMRYVSTRISPQLFQQLKEHLLLVTEDMLMLRIWNLQPLALPSL